MSAAAAEIAKNLRISPAPRTSGTITAKELPKQWEALSRWGREVENALYQLQKAIIATGDTTTPADVAAVKHTLTSYAQNVSEIESDVSSLRATLEDDSRIAELERLVKLLQEMIVIIQDRLDELEKQDEQDFFAWSVGVPVTPWVIAHPLGRKPGVTCLDVDGHQMFGEVVYLGTETVEIYWGGAMAGSAQLT